MFTASRRSLCASHSPATTTRPDRGFELSPRVRLSKIVMRNPLRSLYPLQCNRNCKSKISVSAGRP